MVRRAVRDVPAALPLSDHVAVAVADADHDQGIGVPTQPAMSKIMITGEGDFTVLDGTKVETREGLDLIRDVIVDQHFLKRQRQNRLFGLVLLNPQQLGVGVNEDAALLVTDSRHAEAVGGAVMIVDGRGGKDELHLTVVRPGERFDLVKRQRE